LFFSFIIHSRMPVVWIRAIHSAGLWRWYITILDIIHRPVFYLKTTFRRLDSVSIFNVTYSDRPNRERPYYTNCQLTRSQQLRTVSAKQTWGLR
jgi:hypothetical protein